MCVVENSITSVLFFYTQFQSILHLQAKSSNVAGFVLIGKLIPYNFHLYQFSFPGEMLIYWKWDES